MIYRKTPPQPGRLLLRIVATTGAGSLLGVVACGTSVATPQTMGTSGSAEVLGSTGSGSGTAGSGTPGSGTAGTGYEWTGSTGVAAGGTGASTGYEWAGSGTIGGGAGSNLCYPCDAGNSDASASPDADAATPPSEAGTPDATALEAGRMILGISVAPPDAGFDQ